MKAVSKQTKLCTPHLKLSHGHNSLTVPSLRFLRGTTMFLSCGATKVWLSSEIKARHALTHIQAARGATGSIRGSVHWPHSSLGSSSLPCWGFQQDDTEHFSSSFFHKEGPSSEFHCDTFLSFFECELEDFENNMIWQQAKARTQNDRQSSVCKDPSNCNLSNLYWQVTHSREPKTLTIIMQPWKDICIQL